MLELELYWVSGGSVLHFNRFFSVCLWNLNDAQLAHVSTDSASKWCKSSSKHWNMMVVCCHHIHMNVWWSLVSQWRLTLIVNEPILAGVLWMLLAVTQLHFVYLEVLFFLLLIILIVTILCQSADQLHEYLIIDEATLCETQDMHQMFYWA